MYPVTPLHFHTVLQLIVTGNLLALVLAYKKQAGNRGPVRLFVLSQRLQAVGWPLIGLRCST
ncbi:hypothetical protein [Zoogloea sp.]|uniref:hypothetical protein n=1 Tax=Zoogloea sp. TaxID=49181 RepID=UPI0035B176BD